MSEPCVVVGITGCIAAYKACEVVRGLQKRGARVRVVMTERAAAFVGPLTLRALTDAPVGVGACEDAVEAIPHIRLAEACDLMLIAPCTANVAAKLACGIADDLLTATALACAAPLVVAPAMNARMYEAAATQANLATLRERGVHIIEAECGYQACGEEGPGRLPEPEALVEAVMGLLGAAPAVAGDLAGRRVLVTAGPTVEPIDAVRYVANRSSGKMGYAIAEAALERGAQVTLVSGPTTLEAPKGAAHVPVQTACEMLDAATSAFDDCDIAIFAAAVADMRPAHESAGKLKKGRDDERLSSLEMVPNPDILATCAARRRPGQKVVGFAAETEDVIAHAKAKLASKGADLIVANDVSDGQAFGADDNEVAFVSAEGVERLARMGKRAVADALLDRLA